MLPNVACMPCTQTAALTCSEATAPSITTASLAHLESFIAVSSSQISWGDAAAAVQNDVVELMQSSPLAGQGA